MLTNGYRPSCPLDASAIACLPLSVSASIVSAANPRSRRCSHATSYHNLYRYICTGHRSNQRLQQIDRWAKTDMKHRSPFAQLSWINVIELADNYPFPFLPTHDERILMPIWITWTHAYVVLTVYQCNRILNTAVQVNQTIRTTKINAWPIALR